MQKNNLYTVWHQQIYLVIVFLLIFYSFITLPIVDADYSDNDLVFIHHSCGLNWLNDGLHDALLAKDYIDERNDIYYETIVPSDPGRPSSLGSKPGDNTNMNHWILWFNDYLEGIIDHGCADGFNEIIMFKSCYPISNIIANGTEPGDPFSSTQTIVNYKAVYRHPNGAGTTYNYNGYLYYPLEDVFADNPDILFIPVTAPPRHYTGSTDEEAQRARLFNNWLKNDWLADYYTENPDLNNVAVYDWFDFLAYADDDCCHPNRLKQEYGGGSGNSHPNTYANQESTVDFASGPNNFIDAIWDLFDEESVENEAPRFPSSPTPENGATKVPKTTTQLTIEINDPEGDSFDWTIETRPDIGSGSGSDEYNGTKTCSIYGLDYKTNYVWYVNVTDSGSGRWSRKTFTFTTKTKNSAAVISNPIPSDGAKDVSVSLSELSVIIEDSDGDNLNWSIECNSGDVCSETNSFSGKKCCPIVSSLNYDTQYIWHVTIVDSGSKEWISDTFTFTCESKSGNSDTGPQSGSNPQTGSNSNIKPVANASIGGPYVGYIGVPITFDASASKDIDGEITGWFWDFGDGNNAIGEVVSHAYNDTGEYKVILRVVDDDGAEDSCDTKAVIMIANMAPLEPSFIGLNSIELGIEYFYSVVSIDHDNDNIRYIIDWGDGTLHTTDFIDNNTMINISHIWTGTGLFIVSLYAEDSHNATSSIVKSLILVNTSFEFIQDKITGYLLDYNGDGTYSEFYDNETGIKSKVEINKDGLYLIDINDDGVWDYAYNCAGSLIRKDECETQNENVLLGYEFIIVILISILIIYFFWKRKYAV